MPRGSGRRSSARAASGADRAATTRNGAEAGGARSSRSHSGQTAEPPFTTIEWQGDLEGCARLLDQTRLPGECVYLECRELEPMWEAIRNLRVRGAPAIGIAAAMGVVLGVRHSPARRFAGFRADLATAAARLASARPTAVNLFWALQRMQRKAVELAHLPVSAIKQQLLQEAVAILEEDRATCRAIGRNGMHLLPDDATVMTHCNAGALATGGSGTALAVIYAARAAGKRLHVLVRETRPLLQGARLTTWELGQAGIETTLICDEAAAYVMKQKKPDCVIVGADRIAANGDVANKIGTYGLAICAKEHGVPFYVAAPCSTFDPELTEGSRIPIEERDGSEVACFLDRRVAPEGTRVFNPAFDVTPASYLSAIITERGVISRPNRRRVLAHLQR